MKDELEYRNYLKWMHENYYSKSRRIGGADKKPVEKRAVVSRVVGENSCHLLVEFELEFPHRYPCLEVREVSAKVKDLHFHICKNKAIINGTLTGNIDYKVYEGKTSLRYCGIKHATLFGTLKNISADIAFSSFIEVDGAKSGDAVEVVFADAEACSKSSKLQKPFCIPKSDIVLFRELKQSFLLKICLRVLRQTTVPIRSGHIPG